MPVDIDKAEENVKKASGFFDTLNAFIKKHPFWFAVIVIVGLSELGYLSFLGINKSETKEADEYFEEDYYDYEDAEGVYADSVYYYDELDNLQEEY